MKKLSICIPTYNEKENIEILINKIQESLENVNIEYEIIIIDDNSPDGTAEVAANLSSVYPVRGIVRKKQRGLASAVVAGLSNTKSEIIGSLNADLQHPPDIIPDLLREIEAIYFLFFPF